MNNKTNRMMKDKSQTKVYSMFWDMDGAEAKII